MRFLQVHLSVPKGGAHVAVNNIKKALEGMGHRCDIVNDDAVAAVGSGRYDLVLMHSFGPGAKADYIRCLEVLDARSTPHVIVMHDYWAICHQSNLMMPRMGWKRCHVDMNHPCDPENRCRLSSSSNLLRDMVLDRHIVCFTQRSCEIFREAGFENVHRIPHGIDVKQFSPGTKTSNHDLHVLFTNAWGGKEVKGFLHWEWIKANNEVDNIIFDETLGGTQHKHMPGFLASGDCMVFLSLWEETFGLVVAEAMACGTPVISYPVGIAPEIIKSGENGILVNSSNPKDVLEVIEEMSALREITADMGREARRTIIENGYSIERMAADYIDLAENIR